MPRGRARRLGRCAGGCGIRCEETRWETGDPGGGLGGHWFPSELASSPTRVYAQGSHASQPTPRAALNPRAPGAPPTGGGDHNPTRPRPHRPGSLLLPTSPTLPRKREAEAAGREELVHRAPQEPGHP